MSAWLFHMLSSPTSRWAQNAEVSGGSVSQMLLMEFAPVMSMILYLLSTPVRMPYTSLLVRAGRPKEIEPRFPWCVFVFYYTIVKFCSVLNASVKILVYYFWNVNWSILAYLIFPRLFINFFRVKLLLYSGLLSHKQSVIVLIHSRLIVNTKKWN